MNLYFGYGSHMYLGQHLATLEVSCFIRELLARLKMTKFNGQSETVKAIFVGKLNRKTS